MNFWLLTHLPQGLLIHSCRHAGRHLFTYTDWPSTWCLAQHKKLRIKWQILPRPHLQYLTIKAEYHWTGKTQLYILKLSQRESLGSPKRQEVGQGEIWGSPYAWKAFFRASLRAHSPDLLPVRHVTCSLIELNNPGQVRALHRMVWMECQSWKCPSGTSAGAFAL